MAQYETPHAPDLPQPLKVRKRRRTGLGRFKIFRRIRKTLVQIFGRRFVFVGLFIIVSVFGVGGAILVTDAANRVESSLTSLNRVMDTVTNKPGTQLTRADFDRLKASVDSLSRNLTIARRQLGILKPFSFLSGDVETTLEALDAAQELAAGANDMLTGLEPTIVFLVGGQANETVVAQISSGERIVELLELGRGRFLSADNHLTEARRQMDALDVSRVSSTLLLQLEELDRTFDQIKDMNDLLLDAPELLTVALGLENPAGYLVLAQNNDELRPSGGYISTYGWMSVRNGRVTEYDYRPSTVTTPNPPDVAFGSQISVPDWWIQYQQPIYAAWDGSWYADFPHTAELARWYYDNGDNPLSPIGGVIGIDIVGFEYILEGLGGVIVPGYDDVITSLNFREVVYDIRRFGEADLAHKEFVADVYKTIFDEWQSLDRDQRASTDVLSATLRALQEKHIMLYFSNARLNNAIQVLGWSGAQNAATDHDYLMVADANLGNKSNRSIIRQLTYDVEINSDGTLESRATVSYDYPSRLAENDPAVDPRFHGPIDYNSLIQIFTPINSAIVTTNNLQSGMRTVNTPTHTEFVFRALIPFDSGERFQFTYETPPLIQTFGPYYRYRLLLQKQPGMIDEPVSVQLTLPLNARVVSTSPAPRTTYVLEQPVMEFRVDLLTDEWIDVIFQQ